MNKEGLHGENLRIAVLDRNYRYKMEFKSFYTFKSHFSLGHKLTGDLSKKLRNGKIVYLGGQIICSADKYNSGDLSLSDSALSKEITRLRRIEDYIKRRGRRIIVLDANNKMIEYFTGGIIEFAKSRGINQGTAKTEILRAKYRLINPNCNKSVIFRRGYSFIYERDYRTIKNKMK